MKQPPFEFLSLKQTVDTKFSYFGGLIVFSPFFFFFSVTFSLLFLFLVIRDVRANLHVPQPILRPTEHPASPVSM